MTNKNGDVIDIEDARAQSGDLTGKLFSGESHLSSVRNLSSDNDMSDVGSRGSRSLSRERETSIEEEQKHRQFEALIVPATLQLNMAGRKSNSSSSN